MAQIVFTLPDKEQQELKQKATSLGLTTSGYLRQIIRDSQQKKPRQDIHAVQHGRAPSYSGLGYSHGQNSKPKPTDD